MADSPPAALSWEKLERQLQWGLYDSLRMATETSLARPMDSRDSTRLPRIWLYRGAALYGLGYSDAARESFQTAACMDSSLALDSFYVQTDLPAFYGNIRREMAEGKILCPERKAGEKPDDGLHVKDVEARNLSVVAPPPDTSALAATMKSLEAEYRKTSNAAMGFWAATALLGGWMIWEIDGRQKSWKLYTEAGEKGDALEYDRQAKIFNGHNARTWIAAFTTSLTMAGGTFFTLKALRIKKQLQLAWSGNSMHLAWRF